MITPGPLIARYSDRLPGLASMVAGLLVIVAIPLLLTTTSLRFAINQPRLYEYGFDKYNISERVGIDRDELTSIAGEIRDYFNSDQEFIDIRATIFGQEKDLFTRREIVHMRDVKGLVQGVYLLQWITLGYVLAYGIVYLLWLGRAALPLLARRLLWGGGLTLGVLVVLGLASLVGFDSLFLKFHQLGFSNDFWRLDPRVHNLIAMFPQDFFLVATLLVAVLTIGQALLLVAVAGGYLWRRRRGRVRRRGEVEEEATLLESTASLP
ncbi:MAG: TIGR01906 family membrane protein [Dehalococcoidia bacterium]